MANVTGVGVDERGFENQNVPMLDLEIRMQQVLRLLQPQRINSRDAVCHIRGIEVIENMMKVGELTARLKELEVGLEAAELAKQHAETEPALSKQKAEELNVEVKRLEMMLSSVTGERDRLCKDVLTLNKHKTGEAQSETTNEILIKELESSLTRKESMIRELESSLHEQKEVINHQRGELSIFHEKINIESKRVKSLEWEADRLWSEISLLESKINEYASQREKLQQIEIFIQKMNSIPAFMANLTMESFNKRTLS
ncbi:hypothetical protein QJS10_CPA08g01224 [Acorus calamus]|uniref:Uncharacterized protein n=1 Tax=Acorus calamus TaxID=4465 RepID=A0AAV9EC32_ACOCL|nr:hypothetical protein QJS10_CPA08g01224 [Acorus calamus]